MKNQKQTHQKLLVISQTGVLMALLIVLQAVTKPAGQLVTGSCVNAILAVAALTTGLPGAIAISLISPLLAFLLGIAPQILTVPAIMVGNTVFSVLLCLLRDPADSISARQIFAWLCAALGKFAVLYLTVVWLICGLLSPMLTDMGILKGPMSEVLSATFSYPQLITALIGGGIAVFTVPILRKALPFQLQQ